MRTAIVGMIVAAFAATAWTAFDVGKTDREYTPLDYTVAAGRVYAVLEERIGGDAPRLLLTARYEATGEAAVPDVELWNDNYRFPRPRIVAVDADDLGATILMADRDLYGVRVSAQGDIERYQKIELEENAGLLHGTTRSEERLLAVFSGGVASIDNDFVHHFVPAVEDISAFTTEGGTLWTVDFARRDEATLRGRSNNDDFAVRTEIALPAIRELPQVIAWKNEVVVIAATPNNRLLRCVHQPDTEQVACGELDIGTRTPYLDHGMGVIQAVRLGEGSYVLSVPQQCGTWVRRYGRDHKATRLQPTMPDGGRVMAARFAAVNGGIVGMGIRFGPGGQRQAETLAVYTEWHMGEPVPETPPPWSASCPSWNDVDFFFNASVDEVLDCINAGVPVDGDGLCGQGTETPLLRAVALARDPAVVGALIDAGADPNRRVRVGATVLHLAVWSTTNPLLAERLIVGGANVDVRDDAGMTPLHHFAEHGSDPAVLDALLRAGADPAVKDKSGKLPIEYARDNVAIENLLPRLAVAESDKGL
ncbi:MAG: hypothetical protein OXH09_03465 [Gammaproteobacteria bacterium]|nr:hypothetical protein [Gammaproteobacteria bacterium]